MYSHLAKMWQGYRGEWAYRLPFTHEAHPGLPLVQGFYVGLGALARLTPFSLPLAYHLARFVLTAGMALALWVLACRFFDQARERWLALLFGTLAAGWSWLLLILSPAQTAEVAPIEFWLLDAFNLLGAAFMPHFAAAVILQIIIALTFAAWVQAPDRRTLLALTLALAASSLVQPYGALLFGPLLALLAAYQVFGARRLSLRRAPALLLPAGVYAALTLYQYMVISGDPVWAAFADQNRTLSPPVTYYLLGYLPFILPMAAGLRVFLLDRSDDRWWLPLLWVALVAMLLYAPFPTQRRYLLGVQTPLALMAAYGWARAVLPLVRAGLRRLVTAAYLGLAGAALLVLILANTTALLSPAMQPEVFLDADEAAAMDWMRRETAADALVLTTFDWNAEGSGGRVAGLTGRRVYLGHWIETIDFDTKIADLRRFYDPAADDTWRRALLADAGIAYIWYDHTARTLGRWDPGAAGYLQAVFSSGADERMVTIFAVRP
jgi:hypothetical protein